MGACARPASGCCVGATTRTGGWGSDPRRLRHQPYVDSRRLSLSTRIVAALSLLRVHPGLRGLVLGTTDSGTARRRGSRRLRFRAERQYDRRGQVRLLTQQLSAGFAHTCGIGPSQRIWWGRNEEGQLGQGDFHDDAGQYLRCDQGGQRTALHTCAVTVAGAAVCWGYNVAGQLGDGTTVTSPLPVVVSGGTTWRTDPLVIFTAPIRTSRPRGLVYRRGLRSLLWNRGIRADAVLGPQRVRPLGDGTTNRSIPAHTFRGDHGPATPARWTRTARHLVLGRQHVWRAGRRGRDRLRRSAAVAAAAPGITAPAAPS